MRSLRPKKLEPSIELGAVKTLERKLFQRKIAFIEKDASQALLEESSPSLTGEAGSASSAHRALIISVSLCALADPLLRST